MIYLKQIETGPVENLSYIIANPLERIGTLIDPGWPGEEADKLLDIAKIDGVSIKYIIATHYHSDHSGGIKYLLEKTVAKLLVHEDERESMYRLCFNADIILKDRDLHSLGGLTVKIIHTPGHSPGSICIYSNGKLFTGDTLFVGGCGRADMPRGNPEDLYKSLYDKLLKLPDLTEEASYGMMHFMANIMLKTAKVWPRSG
jgi:glyoxylase-like metal-dependent hydrolase (beta-lactamase superfamily II)